MFRLLATKQTIKSNGRRFLSSSSILKADPAKGKKFAEKNEDIIKHSQTSSATWKKISLFLAIPAILICAVPVYRVEQEHAKHRKALKAIPDDKWPAEYEYQNIRRKKFFWGDGDKTLFWNEGVNRHVKN
ncbi:hypothetical protein HII13_004369 [Brettanomyces bruxellensis]|uniref:Cytochrome c oxidase subunit n=1 Tax=Dekkera bruxellensis TaxID=5007 RepID=A0A3F2Y3R8_DEKBR|nr:uncharacterized protein BRETT_004193 [Brettanomyces bruxellensis]EIF49215.1 cytochrome c oxidase subunit via [Brettanomyces bruxellensis AWRI1499]KAF6007698.1 hypothetical protein HII13_004369 [Brettanomyces bruxellensis]QOU18972.1 hypothetical protein BRETT_004193 [Brettanomyces bruxellensis]VUG17844.1 COX13 [Brettanomyces bruxellensis]